MRGIYVAIEGIDGSGKTRQARKLHKRMTYEGLKNNLVVEPSDGIIGKTARELLKEEKVDQRVMSMLFGADRLRRSEIFDLWLNAGTSIVSDRSFYSSLVYQGDSQYTMFANKDVLVPNKVIVLNVPVHVAQERLSKREELDTFEKDEEFMEECRKRYEWFAANTPWIHIVDATKRPAKVHKQIMEIVHGGIEELKAREQLELEALEEEQCRETKAMDEDKSESPQPVPNAEKTSTQP